MRRYLAIGLVLGLSCVGRPAPCQVNSLVVSDVRNSAYRAYGAYVQLPGEGIWQVRQVSGGGVTECYLYPRSKDALDLPGRRWGEAVQQERIDRGRWKVSSIHWACLDYARDHGGKGPAAFSSLHSERNEYWVSRLDESPWQGRWGLPDDQQPEGPFVFLVPEAAFRFSGTRGGVGAEDRVLLAFELRPYVDDGKHWALYTDGTCIREEISAARVRQYGVTIRPVTDIKQAEPVSADAQIEYMLAFLCRPNGGDAVRVTASNLVTGEERDLVCSLSTATEAVGALARVLTSRKYAWRPYLASEHASVLSAWSPDTRAEGPRRPNRRISAISLLGGRAAIEETLQLQNLNLALPADERATIEVAALTGVEVKSHPFESLLQGGEGGSLPLANCFPPDRLFVHVAKPEAILPFLDDGAEFVSMLGGALTENRLHYGLAERYLQRLGVQRQWLESVLRSGMIRELAISLPDLFLIEGTDITVVAQLQQPQLLPGMLRLLGMGDVGNTAVVRVPRAEGAAAFWAMRGDFLCLSTSEAELNRTLSLIDGQGEGSLGATAEFRYMLTQLPIEAETRCYGYLSDPFIRRLVGPQVKLGQSRRVLARSQMEYVIAQAMKARLDGCAFDNSLDRLVELAYLPPDILNQGLQISPAGVVSSSVYGSLTTYRSLDEVPLRRVTPEEADSYRNYVEEYSRYWRQFFDPIAVRLNDTTDNGLELTTFILPLIDSSVYSRLRDSLRHQEERVPLKIPVLSPTPVLQLSVNLRDEAWRGVGRQFMNTFDRWVGVSPAILDDLGPSLHLAIFDADPVINFGSGDLLGAFGGNGLRAGGDEMLLIPVMLSVLTRRSTILLETQDPQRTVNLLRQAAGGGTWAEEDRRAEQIQASFYQEQGRDAWVWQLDLLGTIKLRFGIEVVGDYVMIRNLPWSSHERIVSVEISPHNGAALIVSPAACREQLPSLYASAVDQQRRQAMSGASRLYPLLLSQTATIETAASRHFELFGFRPVHPPGGTWLWESQQVQSSTFGSVLQQRQPAYDQNSARGLLDRIEQLKLSMQLEDAGLRSSVRWRYDASPERD